MMMSVWNGFQHQGAVVSVLNSVRRNDQPIFQLTCASLKEKDKKEKEEEKN